MLIVICIAWGLATVIGFIVGDPVYTYVVHRAGVKELILINPTGGFFVRFKVALRNGEVLNASPEFEDCVRLADASGRSVKEIQAAATKAWLDARRS